MIEYVDTLLGISAVLIGVVVEKGRARRRQPEQPKAICGCKHAYAMHDLRTGECHDKAKIPVKWDGYGSARGWKFDPCTCRHYTGPIPPETILLPQLPREDGS